MNFKKDVTMLYMMDAKGNVSTVNILGITKIDKKKFKFEAEDGTFRYVTDKFIGNGQGVRLIARHEIGKFFFYTVEEAKEQRLKEFKEMAEHYNKVYSDLQKKLK